MTVENQPYIVAVNATESLTLIDVVAPTPGFTASRNTYISGTPSTVARICTNWRPSVWDAVAAGTESLSTERVVVRVVAVDPRTANGDGVLRSDRNTQRHGMFGAIYEPTTNGHIDAAGLIEDIHRLPALREKWPGDPRKLLTTPAFVDAGITDVLASTGGSTTPGRYDPDWKRVVVETNTDHRPRHPLPLGVELPHNSPPRLGLEPRDDTLFTVASAELALPDSPAAHAASEIAYGTVWCVADDTVLCARCVSGASAGLVHMLFVDYYHFISELHPVIEESARRYAAYIEHCLNDHPESALCQVMDSCLITEQALYLDILHEKADRLLFMSDEYLELRYRLLNSVNRPLTLLTLLEGTHSGIATDETVMAVSLLALSVHDAADRRHDCSANEEFNVFNIVAGHHGAESAYVLGRFCTDVLAWAVDIESLWPIHLAGRYLLWQIFARRYQTAKLLDNVTRSPDIIGDVYCDPILNALNPLLTGSEPPTGETPTAEAMFSVRSRCRNPAWHDKKLTEALSHIRTCDTCHGYDTARWQDRPTAIRGAYLKKHAGDCECVDMLATYSSLTLLDQLWWTASATTHYTGATESWDPLLC